MKRHIRVKPAPYCPACGGRMYLRRPRPDQAWSPFWGCTRYPECKGTRQVVVKGQEQLAFWEEAEAVWELI